MNLNRSTNGASGLLPFGGVGMSGNFNPSGSAALRLATYPVASAAGAEPQPEEEPFLDVWDRPGLHVCLPPTLAQLQGGLPAVNRVLSKARRNEAKRFINLIDTLYDNGIKLVISAAAEPTGLYVSTDGTEAFEFDRTASRLIEMRSEAYIAGERRHPQS